MEIPDIALEALRCNKCNVYLSRGPTYIANNGASLCGRCYTPDQSAIRNTQFETLARLLQFPCKNRDLGCTETVPYADESDEIDHEIVCNFRQYVCPILGSARCDWLGTRNDIEKHCTEKHPDFVLENPGILYHDISKSNLHNYLMKAFRVLFLVHTKVCVTTGKLFYAVRLLDTTNNASKFFFTLNIKRNDEVITKKDRVLPQGCLAIQVDTSLALKTNSLLDVLGGWDGVTFTLMLKSTEAELDVQSNEKCALCENIIQSKIYRDSNGWLCKTCAPDKKNCNYSTKGCNYNDYEDKCDKHETYFCEKRTDCWLCDETILPDTLFLHYAQKHKNRLFNNNITWNAKLIQEWRSTFVRSEIGISVCWYRLNDSGFEFEVHIPKHSNELHEFECLIRVTNTLSRCTRTYSPKKTYDEDFDWGIQVEKQQFPAWNCRFEFSVNIQPFSRRVVDICHP